MTTLQAATTLGSLNPASAAVVVVVADTSITDRDVLLGRGEKIVDSDGNIRFRNLVRKYKDAYRRAPRRHNKTFIIQNVVNEVYAYGGRFLRRLESTEGPQSQSNYRSIVWEVVNSDVAYGKASQAMNNIQRRESKMVRKPVPSLEMNEKVQGEEDTSARKPIGGTGSLKEPPTREQTSQQHSRQDATSTSASLGSANAAVSQYMLHRLEPALAFPVQCMEVYWPATSTATAGTAATSADAAASVHRLPTPALSSATRNHIAVSWKEIPRAYLDLLPHVRERSARPFCSEDLQVLLLAMAYAEAARDADCLELFRTVMAATLDLPPLQLNLNREEVECLIEVHASNIMNI